MQPGALVLQASYSKHLHLRDGGEPLLLSGERDAEGASGAEEDQRRELHPSRAKVDYHFLGGCSASFFLSGAATLPPCWRPRLPPLLPPLLPPSCCATPAYPSLPSSTASQCTHGLRAARFEDEQQQLAGGGHPPLIPPLTLTPRPPSGPHACREQAVLVRCRAGADGAGPAGSHYLHAASTAGVSPHRKLHPYMLPAPPVGAPSAGASATQAGMVAARCLR